MTYFCFIESSILTVPHMEPLESEDLASARDEAEALLAQHDSGTAAHIFRDNQQIASVQPVDGARPKTPHRKKRTRHRRLWPVNQPRGNVAPS